MDQWILCVERERPGDPKSRVVGIGVAGSPLATAREILLYEDVVRRLDARINRFYTEREDGTPNEVFPVLRDSRFYLTTEPVSAESGNVAALPEFGAERGPMTAVWEGYGQ